MALHPEPGMDAEVEALLDGEVADVVEDQGVEKPADHDGAGPRESSPPLPREPLAGRGHTGVRGTGSAIERRAEAKFQ